MNLTTLTDAVTPANTQSFTYDAVGRLASGSGPYGARAYTWTPPEIR